jgi:acyl carrier protein
MSEHQQTIYDTLRRVAEEEGLHIGAISDSSALIDNLGFRSLHLARILAILEIEFSYDPFASGDIPITGLRTVGDLCAAYER